MAHSYCATHGTHPIENEPCWQCANPRIEEAYEDGKKEINADLLEACKAMLDASLLWGSGISVEIIEQVREAIAKAEGKEAEGESA